MTTRTPESVALAYLDAIGKQQLDRVAALVAPDLHFVGPARTIDGVQDFLAALRRLGAVHVRNDVKRVFRDGNEVCVIYDFVTDTMGTIATIEWLRIENDRVRSVNLYYDQLPWLSIRDEIARRTAQASA